MNRAKKNILTIIVTLLLTASIGFTVYQIKSQNTPPSAPTGQMQQQTNNQSGSSSSDSSDNNSSSNNNSSSSSNNIIKGDNSNNQNSNNSSNNSNNSNQQTPPEKPSSDQKQNAPKTPSTNIATKYIVLLGAETFFWVLSILYLIFTGFHKRSFKEAFASWKKFTVCGLAAILMTCGLTFGETYVVKQLSTPAQMQQPGNNSNGTGGGPGGAPSGNGSGSSNSDNDSASAKATATKTVSKNNKTLSGSYTSKKSDQSAVLVKNGATLTLNNAVLNKASGDS